MRRSASTRVILLVVLAAALPAIAADDIRVSEPRAVYAGASGHQSLRLPLHLYLFSGSRWNRDDVVRALPAVSALLAQCGMTIAPAELRLVDAPPRFRSYSTPVSRELLRALQFGKPAVFFVDATLHQPAYDAETIGLANARSRPELAHTIWVAYGARDLPQTLAHELVHLLSNSGEHSAEPGNLMRDETSEGNLALSAPQCSRARRNGQAQGLLAGRERR